MDDDGRYCARRIREQGGVFLLDNTAPWHISVPSIILRRPADHQGHVYQPLAKPPMALHRNLKRGFAHQNLSTPGCMYPEL